MPNKRKPRTCEVCTKTYRPTYGQQRTCGRACGAEIQRRNCEAEGKAYGGRSPRVCGRCGKPSESVTTHGKRCTECQNAIRVIAPRTCDECGATFTPANNVQKRCTPECANRARIRIIKASIVRRYRDDPEFRDKVISAAQNRRARKLGVEQIVTHAALLSYLAKRDHGRCGICRKPVRAKKGPMRPSIDHIIPLSRGGRHELANVQLAHYRCNLAKKDRGGGEQLLLVG